MRRFLSSVLLLVVVAAVFAPAASASIAKNVHACCLKRHYDTNTLERQNSCGPMQHSCCGATLNVAATLATRPAAAVKPAASHPFLQEFYPDADSSDSVTRQAQRAPPTTSSEQ